MTNRHPLLPRQINRDAPLHLVCLPYAGGGAAVYHRWRPFMPAGIEVVPLLPPGREGRIGEPACTDLLALARDGADVVSLINDHPVALLGHSLGAYVAVEIARELRRRNQPSPVLLALSASSPPHLAKAKAPISQLGNQDFVEEMVRRYDGIPPAIRAEPRLLDLLLPALRADVRMWENYHPANDAPLDLEIMALGGTQDHGVSLSDLQAWREYTTGRFSTRLFPGGHFFLFRNQEEGSTSAAPNLAGLRAIGDRLQKLLET